MTDASQLDERRLMDLYAESNLENTAFFCPDVSDRQAAVRQVEAGYLTFLREEFFTKEGNVYWVYEENGAWVSALRTSQIRPALYYLEALETAPDHRGRGYASRLLTAVIAELKKRGSFCLCDCVGKKNVASIQTHLKCGFQIVSEEGYDYLRQESSAREYGFAFQYNAT
jgi:L-amino acid N-acyltransferase YncA